METLTNRSHSAMSAMALHVSSRTSLPPFATASNLLHSRLYLFPMLTSVPALSPLLSLSHAVSLCPLSRFVSLCSLSRAVSLSSPSRAVSLLSLPRSLSSSPRPYPSILLSPALYARSRPPLSLLLSVLPVNAPLCCSVVSLSPSEIVVPVDCAVHGPLCGH